MSIETLARQDKAPCEATGHNILYTAKRFSRQEEFYEQLSRLRALRSRTQESHCFT